MYGYWGGGGIAIYDAVNCYRLSISPLSIDRTPGWGMSKRQTVLYLSKSYFPEISPDMMTYAVIAAFPFGWCSNGLMYEMGVELMFPLPPCFVAGYMTLLNNLFVDVVYIALYFQPVLGAYTHYYRLYALGLSSGARCTRVLGTSSAYRTTVVRATFRLSVLFQTKAKRLPTNPFSTRSIRFISQSHAARVLGECILAKGVEGSGAPPPRNVFIYQNSFTQVLQAV